MLANIEQNDKYDRYYKSIVRCLEIMRKLDKEEETLQVLGKILHQAIEDRFPVDYITSEQESNTTILSQIILTLTRIDEKCKNNVCSSYIQTELKKMALEMLAPGANPVSTGLNGSVLNSPISRCIMDNSREGLDILKQIFEQIEASGSNKINSKLLNNWAKNQICKYITQPEISNIVLDKLAFLCEHGADPITSFGGWENVERIIVDEMSDKHIPNEVYLTKLEEIHDFLRQYNSSVDTAAIKLQGITNRVKFRGKAIKNLGRYKKDEWVKGSLFILGNITAIMTGEKTEDNKDLNIPVDTMTLGQYIGIKDKNRVEIYENDVVKDSDNNRYIVQWSKKAGIYLLDKESYIRWKELSNNGNEKIDVSDFGYEINNILTSIAGGNEFIVIGNVHDDPEILFAGYKRQPEANLNR